MISVDCKCFVVSLLQVEKSTWKSVDHNMGMAFDRNMWNEIKKCSEVRAHKMLCVVGTCLRCDQLTDDGPAAIARMIVSFEHRRCQFCFA